MTATNPYIFQEPVRDERAFVGRTTQFEGFLHILTEPAIKLIAVDGPPRIGKSSFLRQLEYLASDADSTQVFIDLAGKGHLYLDELLYDIAQTIAHACAFRPPRSENFDRDGRYFAQVFLPTIEKALVDQHLILLFDEFGASTHYKAGQAGREFVPFLLASNDHWKTTRIVYVTSRRDDEQKLLDRFHFVFKLQNLSEAEWRDLVRRGEMSGTIHWSQAAVEELWKLTLGHPFLTQALCAHLWEYGTRHARNAPFEIETTHVTQIVPDVLSVLANSFDSIFRRLGEAERAVLALLAMAGNSAISLRKIADSLQRNRIELTGEQLQQALLHLTRQGWITPAGEAEPAFRVAAPLFAAWIAQGQAPASGSTPSTPEGGTQDAVCEKAVITRQEGYKNQLVILEGLEQAEDWETAIGMIERMIAEYPDASELRSRLRNARNKLHLEERYQQAIQAIERGKLADAQRLLAEVILREPAYKDAPHYLLLATTGIDARQLRETAEQYRKDLEQAKAEIDELKRLASSSQVHAVRLQEAEKRIRELELLIQAAEKVEKPPAGKKHAQTGSAGSSSWQRPGGGSSEARQGAAQQAQESPIRRPKEAVQEKTASGEAAGSRGGGRNGAESNTKEQTETFPLDEAMHVLESVLSNDDRAGTPDEPASDSRPRDRKPPASGETQKDRAAAIKTTKTSSLDSSSKMSSRRRLPRAAVVKPSESPFSDNGSGTGPSKQRESLSAKPRSGLEHNRGPKKALVSPEKAEAKLTKGRTEVHDPRVQLLPQVEQLVSGELPGATPESERKRTQAEPRKAPLSRGGRASSPAAGEQPDPPPAARMTAAEREAFQRFVLAKKIELKRIRRRKVTASWIAGTLCALPVFLWVIWLWIMQPLEWGNGGKLFVLVTIVPAWLALSSYGSSEKDKHVRGFWVMSPITAFCFYAVLTFESTRPGIPDLFPDEYGLMSVAALIYISVMLLFAVQAGRGAIAASNGAVAGGVAGLLLYASGGGALEATVALTGLVTFILLFNRSDVGTAFGGGVLAGIPLGFLLYAITSRLQADSIAESMQLTLLSLLAHLLVFGAMYAMVVLIEKLVPQREVSK